MDTGGLKGHRKPWVTVTTGEKNYSLTKKHSSLKWIPFSTESAMEPWHGTTDWELAKQPCFLPNPEKNWNCSQFQQKSNNNQENTGLLDMTEATVCHPNTRYAECEKRSGEHSLMEMPCGSVKDPSLSRSTEVQRILGQFKPTEKSRNSVCVSEKKKRWSDPRNVRNRRKQHKYLIWMYAHITHVLNYQPEVQNKVTGMDSVNFSTPHMHSPPFSNTRERKQ